MNDVDVNDTAARYSKSWTEDGVGMTLRHIAPVDVELMLGFVRGLSFGTRYFRFGSGDREFTEQEVQRVCSPNKAEAVHFIVIRCGKKGDEVIGSARFAHAAGGMECELGIAVSDRWQTRGIGKVLVEALIEAARERGLAQMLARIQGTNRRMVRFVTGLGFQVADSAEGPGIKLATLRLSTADVNGLPKPQ
jgi:acetyltransferase